MFELSPLLIPIIALCIPIVAIYTKHREKMLGVTGRESTELKQTVALLTETLERQHDRIQTLTRRLETLETGKSLNTPAPRLTIPEAEPTVPTDERAPIRLRG